MRISLTTTCGVSSFNAESASRAEENVLNSIFSRASACSNTPLIGRSSSMIHTGFMFLSFSVLWHRQQDRKVRPAGHAFEGHRAPMLRNEILSERKAEPTSTLTTRNEGIENALTQCVRD